MYQKRPTLDVCTAQKQNMWETSQIKLKIARKVCCKTIVPRVKAFAVTHSLSLEVRFTGSDFDRRTRIIEFTRGIDCKVGPDILETQRHLFYIFFSKPISSAQFSSSSQSQWSIWPILVEWPLDALESRNKNERVARSVWKRMVLGVTGFAELMTPGRVIDLKLTKITKFRLEGSSTHGSPQFSTMMVSNYPERLYSRVSCSN